MFFETKKNNHGLPHDPIKALVTPRPIGWISTKSKDGVPNLAPYSFFNLLSHDPYIVGFSSGMRKDSQRNAEETGEFVCNFASCNLVEAINQSSDFVPSSVNEFELAKVTEKPSQLITPPGVAEAHAHLECTYMDTIKLDGIWNLVLGRVVGVHIDDQFIKEGLVDTKAMSPLARLGYMDYGKLGEVFSKKRPQEFGNMS